jgi:hypothetical protein
VIGVGIMMVGSPLLMLTTPCRLPSAPSSSQHRQAEEERSGPQSFLPSEWALEQARRPVINTGAAAGVGPHGGESGTNGLLAASGAAAAAGAAVRGGPAAAEAGI